jgi:hypothetical protein
VRWFSAERLPWPELAFPSTRSAFMDYFTRHGLAGLIPEDLVPGDEF